MTLDRKTPPPIHEINACTLKPPLSCFINNEVPLYLFINPNLELIHFIIKVKAGTIYEPIKYVANAAYQLLKESSTDYSAVEMDEFLTFHGASWKTYIHTQFITIRWIIPKRNLDKVLPVLWKTITQPAYKNDGLHRFKESKIKDLEYNSAKFNYRATQLMFAQMFSSNTPIGTILTKEHIDDLTVEQLHEYHAQTFTVGNVRLFITGNVEAITNNELRIPNYELKDINNSQFSVLSSQFPVLSSQFSILNSQFIIESREGALQSSFILCKKNIGYTHEDRRNFEILSTLFGGFFGSRLMQNLREVNGYTYGVFCNSLFYENQSIFYIEADVVVDNTKESIDECFKEMLLLQKEPVTEEELSLVKSYLLGELLRQVDGSVSYLKKYIYWNDFQLDETEMQMMIDAIQEITPQTIQSLAQQYLSPETFTTIVVGKLEN